MRFAEAGEFLITVDRSVEEEVPEYLSKAAGVKHYPLPEYLGGLAWNLHSTISM